MDVDIGKLLSGDKIINLRVKIYAELESFEPGKNPHGKKTTAKDIKDIKTGYVYVFREYPHASKGGDEPRTLVYAVLDISRGINLNVLTNDSGRARRYFFMYSRIQLSDSRVEQIRKDVGDFINAPGQNFFCRAEYIPLFPGQTNIQRDYLRGTAADENVDFGTNTDRYYPTIYLHDWFKYLDDITKEYQMKLQEYKEYLSEDFDLLEYNTELSRFLGKNSQYPYEQRMKDHNHQGKSRDVFPRGDLYGYTKALEELIKIKAKAGGSNPYDNLRRHAETVGPQNKEYPLNELHGRLFGIHPVPYDYYSFLKTTEDRLRQYRNILCPLAGKIEYLYTEKYRRLHGVLIDYLNAGSGEMYVTAHELIGNSMENLCSFLASDDTGTGNGNNTPLLAKEILDGSLKRCMEKIAEKNHDCVFQTPVELHAIIHDRDAFAYIITVDNIKLSLETLGKIFETISELCPTVSLDHSYSYIFDGRFKYLRGTGRVVSTDRARLNRWLSHRPGYAHLKARAFSEQVDAWKGWHEERIKEIFGNDTMVDVVMEPNAKANTHILRMSKMIDPTPSKVRKLKNITHQTAQAIESFCVILDGFNIINQAVVLTGEGNSPDEIAIALFSSFGSASSMVNAVAGRMELQRVAVPAGALASVLSAAVLSLEARKKHEVHDDDAAGVYAESAMLTVAGLLVLYMLGPAPAVIVSVFNAVFTAHGLRHTVDDHIDVYLKYCIWGNHYREDWTGKEEPYLPSWWPNQNTEGNIEEVICSELEKYEIKPNDALRLYDDDLQKILKHNDALLRVVAQMPMYRVAFDVYHELYDRGYSDYIVVSVLEIQDLSSISTIELNVFQERERRWFDFSKTKDEVFQLLNPAPVMLFPVEDGRSLIDGRGNLVDSIDNAEGIKFFCYSGMEAFKKAWPPGDIDNIVRERRLEFTGWQSLRKKKMELDVRYSDGRLPVRIIAEPS
jgi:hypothetical protein